MMTLDSLTHDAADQAAGLRSLMGRQAPRMVAVVTPGAPANARVARSLASALARQRRQVLVVDEAVAPVTVLCAAPNGTLSAAIRDHGHKPFASLGELTAISPAPMQFVLVDAHSTSAGLSPLAAGAHEILVVVPGNDPTGAALTDAYACIKNLHTRHALLSFRILPTACDVESRAYGVFCRLATVASRYLTVSLSFAGYLPAGDASPVILENAYMNVARGMSAWFR